MKILSFKIIGVIEICPVYDRWYRLARSVTIAVWVAGEGWILYRFRKGFLFDGRSGGPFADLFVPNLGTPMEVACWLVHDANGYDVYLCFEATNEMLRQMLIIAGRRWIKAQLVKCAVGLSDDWFGFPQETDREYENVIPGKERFNVDQFARIEDCAEVLHAD